ncbi:MAG: extracellular matrix regulator RemB [Monoglobaceae bacterium]
MYLHLGNGTIVNSADVIAIMDLESSSLSANTREFLKIVEEEGFVRNVSDEIPKTFIVCEIDGQSVVYVSNISSKALMGRASKY